MILGQKDQGVMEYFFTVFRFHVWLYYDYQITHIVFGVTRQNVKMKFAHFIKKYM